MGSCVDAELWKVCAGDMVKVPLVNSKVMYFPQGHAEHTNETVNFDVNLEIPDRVECRVASVKYMANAKNDELYLRMRLVPVSKDDDFVEFAKSDLVAHFGEDGVEKCSSFTKTLTQSDANNGGGFSVPRYCAESLFPKLDYSADPPVQNLLIKDVHGVFWKFRHIYRGTPRRHLLTTGWSNFVNDKELVAGDSVIFLRARNGELYTGIRRAKREMSGINLKGAIWELPEYANALGNDNKGGVMSIDSPRKRGKVSVEKVLETARLASTGKAFEVDYYPCSGFPEFCVESSVVDAALRIKWCVGMKFKMALETDDATKVSWFDGTIKAVEAADPIRWPTSLWRVLQVTWDEPNLSHHVDRVSPWSVNSPVGSLPNMHLFQFSSPMKRLRLAQPQEVPSPDPFVLSRLYNPPADNVASGIQGARHVQLGQYPLNPHLNIPPNPVLFPQLWQPFTAPLPAPVGDNVRDHKRTEEDPSHLLSLGKSQTTTKNNEEPTSTEIVLFGQRIAIDVKKSQSSSASTPVSNSNMLSDGNMDEMKNAAESSESESVQNGKECSSDTRDFAGWTRGK